MTRKALLHTFTRTGGVVGFLLFLAFGLVPGMVYGGFFGLTMLNALLGKAFAATLVGRLIVGGGMALGVLAVGAILTVVGAIVGTALGGLVLPPETEELEVPKAAEPTPEPAKT